MHFKIKNYNFLKFYFIKLESIDTQSDQTPILAVMDHILDVIDANTQLIDSSIIFEAEQVQEQKKTIESLIINQDTDETELKEETNDDSDIEVLTVSSKSKAIPNSSVVRNLLGPKISPTALSGISEHHKAAAGEESESTVNNDDSSLIISNYEIVTDSLPAKLSCQEKVITSTDELSTLLDRVDIESDDEVNVKLSTGAFKNSCFVSEALQSTSGEVGDGSENGSGKPFFASKLTTSQLSEELSHEIGL